MARILSDELAMHLINIHRNSYMP